MTERAAKTRELVSLLTFLLRGPARIEPEDAGASCTAGCGRRRKGAGTGPLAGEGLALLLEDGTRRRFSKPLIAACASRGLLTLGPDRCFARPEAQATLKRLLAGTDGGFAAQHGQIQQADRRIGDRLERVAVNADSSALQQVQRMKGKDGAPWFSDEAIAAGERLAADFQFAGLQPRVTASWQPKLDAGAGGMRGAQADMSDHVADARARVNRAAAALGPELAGVALDVCCFSKGLERVEQERNWPARSAKLMLRTALLALARHYGIGGGGKAGPSTSSSRELFGGFLPDAVDHRAQPVRTLRREMFDQTDLRKKRRGIE